MRIPFISMFVTSPFEGLEEHAAIVKDCAGVFQHAVECYVLQKYDRFDDLRQEIIQMERKADAVKRRIRGHIPLGTLMPVDKFQFMQYLKEQDNVLDEVEEFFKDIKHTGFMEAIAQGRFADVKRPVDGGYPV